MCNIKTYPHCYSKSTGGGLWIALQYSMLVYFGDTNTLNVALRDPKVKRTRGELHMMAHENSTTRDESVKRGGGSVTAVEIRNTS